MANRTLETKSTAASNFRLYNTVAPKKAPMVIGHLKPSILRRKNDMSLVTSIPLRSQTQGDIS